MREFASAERLLFSDLVARGYSPKVVYDIGASNGYWSEIIATVFTGARFELFEPLANSLATSLTFTLAFPSCCQTSQRC